MRSKSIAVVLALATALAGFAATPAKKPKPTGAKKTATKASAAKTSRAKGASAAKSTSGKKAASSGKKSASARQAPSKFRRSSQREPAPERYQEIQQSLAEKGYFSGPVNGTWGADSVAALKRFQRDQNIGDDGKLGSLSLIALGLGPKRGSPETPPPGGEPHPQPEQ
ncbi:MAG TPA: peptidoglycan-binding protein [Bryobacteraceae bacterium]|nr:peptidoglycan-binding protein [Bryobacteraceae bacterium]